MAFFIGEDFLLHGDAACRLYHEFAEGQPIFDYHCHLPASQIAKNHRFRDLTEIWLEGDHYKWRAMRANGVDERLITGDASPWEKFEAWVATTPYTLRNPLYQWSHLELLRYFGIDLPIMPANAREIWDEANRQLATLTTHEILRRNRVAVVCTTDDPADSLEDHRDIAKSRLATRVYPAFRPDKALSGPGFGEWTERLAASAGVAVRDEASLIEALRQRHRFFHERGCRLSDHGLTSLGLGGSVRGTEFPAEKWGSPRRLMVEFGRWDAAAGWTKQLHLGALRNAASRGWRRLGPDTGFDGIGDYPQAESLAAYLDDLDREESLPKMVLYNVNPSNNYLFAAMAATFQGGGIVGKIQYGSGWWFLDQKEGIEWQLNALSNNGLLRRFVGMLTDSRSFLSYTRHEYFRRVLCNMLGAEMDRGELPPDFDLIGAMVSEICFDNARRFFGLSVAPEFDR
jgi:glucuronate isomerase